MYQLSSRFPQKRVFITGAGSGLGREMALKLAADGWHIGITDLNQAALDESKKMIEALGGKAFPYCYNVADRADYEKHFADFISTNGGIDVLINNAGVGDGGLFDEYSLDNWEWITGINQQAVIVGCHLALPIMKAQRSGHIINIASVAGIANMPNMSMYNVTKAAVISLSESLYAEIKPFGIGISLVLPTFFRSNIMQHNRGPAEATSIGKKLAEKAKVLPDVVAEKILVQAGADKFHILHPFQAYLAWYFKRFFPTLFLKFKRSGFERKEWFIKKIQTRV